jgi:predicted nucleic acid-binding protein
MHRANADGPAPQHTSHISPSPDPARVRTPALLPSGPLHRLLAASRQHRHFRLPDLIIAATAEQHGATVLHYDTDYDRIAAVTGQPVEWVAEKGSL